MTELSGTLSALVTPFTDGGAEVDESALRVLVDKVVDDGIDGIVPCGGTGEFATMTNAERRRVVEIVLDQVAGRIPVVPHVGAGSTAQAVELSRHAADHGAAALLLTVPYFEPITEPEAAEYYTRVAGSVALPIVAYNQPAGTGLQQHPAFLRELASRVPAVRYVKDSFGDLGQLYDFATADEPVRVLNGVDSVLGPAFLLGVRGHITGGANFLGAVYRQITDAVRAGDQATVARLWVATYPVARLIENLPYNAAVKAACELTGRPASLTRSPARPLTADEHAVLARALRTLEGAVDGLVKVAR
ncbi:4-hydroxy-tetrahydrodipicolinate synthase [Amycolatopsis ultiminotia]|uniref:4-hydroxy-tetrahydrodipicolinate synthase n=1 Tax=Amycolatopsis ultiminotia TaxID=543629 RepID=A0ABP6YHB6_9PSEU